MTPNYTACTLHPDLLLCELHLGPSTASETGRAHWDAALQRPGQRIFMWHPLA